MRARCNQITITGHPGGGKTTAAKLLAKELGWEYFYTGAVQRQLAAELGITTLEFNKRSETDPALNCKIDEVYVGLNQSEKPLVVDARLAWHFMPNSFKVRFEVPVEVGAKRIFEFAKRDDEQYRDLESATRALAERRQSEQKHYKKDYGIDVEDDAHFDLILDTTFSSPERNVSMVRAVFSLWYKGIRLPRVWSSPQSLYPTAVIDAAGQAAAQALATQIEQTGFDVVKPIHAVRHNGQLFIIDGHERASGAVMAKVDFVPVLIMPDNTDFVRTHAVPAVLHAWEARHGEFLIPPRL